ncbi:serine/threonine protein kinase SCH9 [Aspergillus clavatus NRRL 1]|uniref:non-specific serine/threonine protein kinase n=1 Tax=Aspergillus clavatus (strain ATCC 1007 / CBS 513.65 / DSM 816 / NCTC 3887 / NRRL 1 / QM 1276 / 107) TaxID=344612 RepID=A1CR23_ASPCL|nr:cAMP-dependent protein kinase, putative [Aspergillus clavatus NRRL 1]EAW08094.1 cAMP-dependent protein kinase, putative [Aspergillus clavatus NRRL 1]
MAAAQSGTDLHGDVGMLKQPVSRSNHSQEDNNNNNNNQDTIGSNRSTPSGIATPQPDLTDKRQPSIMHSYFQVGPSSSHDNCPSNSWFPFSETVASFNDKQPGTYSTETRDEQGSGHNSSSSGSFVMMERDGASDIRASSVPPDKKLGAQEISPESLPPTNLPTPPYSSACSLLQKEPEESELGSSAPEKGMASIFTALKSYLSPSTANPAEPQARRHTSHPVSSISDDPVLASHFSNPSLPPASDPLDLPEVPLLAHEKPLSMSSENLTKLTGNLSDASCPKNTPPLTPRAMSNEGSQTAEKNPPVTSCPRSSEQSQSDDMATSADEIAGKLNEAFPSQLDCSESEQDQQQQQQSGPSLGPLKGKLYVKITEARGIRPGFDPYVVCVFEWNEVISKSAHDEEEASIERQQKEKEKSDREAGRPMAIPMKSRQSSNNSALEGHDPRGKSPVADPHWNHEATFDVLGEESEIDVSVYDRNNQEAFLGHVRLSLNLKEDHSRLEGWFPLSARGAGDNQISGEIHLEMLFEQTDKKQVGPNDFQILKLIGKGTFGQVYQVMKKDTHRIYAMKVLSKKVIIQKKEVAHTLGERNILVRTAMAASPFIVGLKFSFQTPTDLYLVTDYMSGGELFWHLQKEGRFQEARAKFYIAELILALQHLHDHDIVYRDLKPENILLDANGHIALCDFGLSKANLTQNDTTNTFCGTTEYLAPEVLLDEQGYTKMVDFWSLGVLVFEMCCGWSPFYAEDTQQMYKNIAFGKVRFPRDALSTEGRNFVKGLLNRNPSHRLGAKGDAKELMAHPFFNDVDWQALARKEVIPPFKPKLKSDTDTSNFDPEFTNALENNASLNDRAAALANGFLTASTPLSPGMQANFKGFTFVNESSIDHHMKHDPSDHMEEDPEQWQRSHQHGNSIDQHMSGVHKSNDGSEPGIFNVDDNFDM